MKTDRPILFSRVNLASIAVVGWVCMVAAPNIAAQTIVSSPVGIETSYPVHSYPTNSYPTSTIISEHGIATNTTPVISSSNIVSSGIVSSGIVSSGNIQAATQSTSNVIPTQSLPQTRRQKSSSIPTTPIERGSAYSSNRNPTIDSRPLSQFASSRTYFPDNRQLALLPPATSPIRYFEPIDELKSPYSLSLIQSARSNAANSRRIAETVLPFVATIALENARYADQWAELAENYRSLYSRVRDANINLDATERDIRDVRAKLEQYGLTPIIGLMLRNKKERLSAWQVEDSQTIFTSQELQRCRQEKLNLEMVHFDGSDVPRQVNEIISNAGYDEADPQNSNLVAQVRHLMVERANWLGAMIKGYQDYQQKLGELDGANSASEQLHSDYRKLINRHITWIRSGNPVSAKDFRDLKGGFATLFDAQRSEDFAPTVRRKLNSNASAGIMLLISMITILVARWRAKSWLVGIGARTKFRDVTEKTRQLLSGALTVVTSLGIPAILYLVGRWFGLGIVSESTIHASHGFFAASLVALMMELPRQLLRTCGYVDKFVEIELPGRKRATKYLMLTSLFLVIAAYTITVMGAIDHGMWRDSIARFGFVLAMLLVAWIAHRWLRPSGGFLEPIIQKFGGKVIHRVRFVLYLFGIAFPLAMIALSAFGYGFTARELVKRAMITLIGLLVAATVWPGIKIVSAYLWQLLTGTTPPPRKFDEYGEIEQKIEEGTGVLGEHFLELKHHLAFLCQCGLVVTGIVLCGWLWLDIFPNVQMGNPVVWTVQDSVTRTSLDAAGQSYLSTYTEDTPITLLHVLAACATLFVAFQIAKLLPALFDALVLQRVSFDEGMEHFSLVLGRCLLFGIGCLIACRWLGVRWTTIQWLAVGLTIGLGFGLQDMVRNLFGGLIVLFEKPARLGDLITVGNVTGRVAAQKLRTTVVSDDDGREVIIPNKKFVSDDVINWMGAGRLTVLPIEVAVKRDERPADVCRELQQLVAEQSEILLTPAPQATLVCVGQRSQRIEVRAWIEEIEFPERQRDTLLKLVRDHLREKQLLTKQQPTQPSLDEANDPSRKKTRVNRRKRTA